MNVTDAWELVKYKAASGPELPTTPTTKSEPRWFSVTIENDMVWIDNATQHKPSSRLKNKRSISFKNFSEVFPYYERRIQGERVSKTVSSLTRNQVYIYSMIHFLVCGNPVQQTNSPFSVASDPTSR